MSTTTKHTCGGPVFGKKIPGCPRCDEMIAGAPAVKWSTGFKRENDRLRAQYAKMHNCTSSRCGPVCTANEW